MDKATDKQTVLGPATRITGEIRGDEDLVVRGRVEGKIQLTETLTVEEDAIVQADVDVRALVVSGVVVGRITASESVRLTSKARVVGDLNTPRLVMDAGASFRGKVDMGEGEAARPAARRSSADSASERTATRSAPARVTETPRVLAASGAKIVTPPGSVAVVTASGGKAATLVPPPRVAASTPRMAAAPSGFVGGASAPAWAKKKARRR